MEINMSYLNNLPNDGQCMVGTEGHRCPYLAVGAVAIGVVPTVYHAAQEPTRGVVLLCERHIDAPPSAWEPSSHAGSDAPPPVDQCPDCGQKGTYDRRIHIGGRGVYRCPEGHMWQDADETPSDDGYSPLTIEVDR